ncbi:MAG: hypothetical protein AMJ53_11645 [Gammaproteobacteria bacterium SG8_11]|nr:MAG: hypothetical protein AMJ53_11645 [Gammaproteobacteria bacterium SG8_11]
MKEFFDDNSPAYNVSELGNPDDSTPSDSRISPENGSMKNTNFMRQIEILRENKMLMSSLKDIYDF